MDQHHSLKGIFKLPNITRPVIIDQCVYGSTGETLHGYVVLLLKIFKDGHCCRQDILLSVPDRGHCDREDIDPME